jgi:hypothetical protein
VALARQDFAGWVIEAMRRRGRVVIRSQGRSMHPAIPDGASIEVRPVVFDELRPGDIVVFHYAGHVFCHRLLRKTGRFCILKGDTLLCADPPVAWSQVIGRVTMLIDGGMRLIPLDNPAQRRRAAWRARASYPYALLYQAGRAFLRWLNRSRVIRLPDD